MSPTRPWIWRGGLRRHDSRRTAIENVADSTGESFGAEGEGQYDAEGGKSATGGLTERDVVVEIEAIDSDQGSAARSSHTSGIGARAWVVDDG